MGDFGFIAMRMVSDFNWRRLNRGGTYLGLMVVIFFPELDATNSLLMNRPVGSVILRPFGAVRSTWRDMIEVLRGECGERKSER